MQNGFPKYGLRHSESDCLANFGPIPPLAPAPWQAWQLFANTCASAVALRWHALGLRGIGVKRFRLAHVTAMRRQLSGALG